MSRTIPTKPLSCDEKYYDFTIQPHYVTKTANGVSEEYLYGHQETCRLKPEFNTEDFAGARGSQAIIPFEHYHRYETEESSVAVAVPVTEPVPCFFPAPAEQQALILNENLKKTNPKNPPRYKQPPPPEIPDVTYDETKDKKKRKKKITLPYERDSVLPVVPEEQKHSFDDPEPIIPPENVNTTTEDQTYDTIYKIGMFVAIAGIVYLLFNPTKNTNPGKDLGENAAFQGLSEL
jgi:hypothetical protein